MQDKIESESVDVTIIGVPNPLSDAELINEFITDRAATVVHNTEDAIEIWQHFAIATQPAMVLIDADGSTEVLTLAQGRTGLWWRVQDLV